MAEASKSSAPIALGLLGAGSIVVLSGIQGLSIGQIIKGEFGPTPPASGKLEGSQESAEGSREGSPTSLTSLFAVTGGVGHNLLSAARTQIGTPYRWGGEIEKVAFDCSGLVQWAAKQVGIRLPRTAQEQYSATGRVSASGASPGDLVFFGSSPANITHVGIVAGPGLMLDAPHTGASVRFESFPQMIGASWGSDKVIGFGRP